MYRCYIISREYFSPTPFDSLPLTSSWSRDLPQALVAERKEHLAEAATLRADVGAGNAALFDALLNRVVANCVMIGEHEMLTRAVLAGLGFCPRDQATPTRMLEQQLLRRLELARALVRATGASGKPRAAPLLIVLNDPDTFLDLRAKVWLERYGAFIFV